METIVIEEYTILLCGMQSVVYAVYCYRVVSLLQPAYGLLIVIKCVVLCSIMVCCEVAKLFMLQQYSTECKLLICWLVISTHVVII